MKYGKKAEKKERGRKSMSKNFMSKNLVGAIFNESTRKRCKRKKGKSQWICKSKNLLGGNDICRSRYFCLLLEGYARWLIKAFSGGDEEVEGIAR